MRSNCFFCQSFCSGDNNDKPYIMFVDYLGHYSRDYGQCGGLPELFWNIYPPAYSFDK